MFDLINSEGKSLLMAACFAGFTEGVKLVISEAQKQMYLEELTEFVNYED